MIRFHLKAEETYIRVVSIIYLILGSLGLATLSSSRTGNPFSADFWRLFGLNDNLGLVLIYFIIGAVAAVVGMLIGTPEPAYTTTMIISPILVLLGIVGFISPNYFGLLNNNVGIGDNILNILIGAVGLYIVLTQRMKSEGGETQPSRYGM